MEPATLGLIGKGIGGLVGMIGGSNANKRLQERQREYIEELQKQGVLTPDQYVSAYEMIDAGRFEEFLPQLESAINLGDTELANIQTNPALREAKMNALNRMTQLGEEGMTLDEEAALNQINRSMGESNRGQQDAVMQSMARRGQLGSGAELAARMSAQGNAFDQASRESEALATERNRRALQAVLESGNMASNIENQEYGRGKDLASARDAISEFNARNQQNVQARNVGAQNQAKGSLVDQRNQSYLTNVGLRNTQADQLAGGTVSHQNALNAKAQLIADAKMGNANQQYTNSMNSIKGIQGAISGVADYAPNIIKMFNTPKTEKTPNIQGAVDKQAKKGPTHAMNYNPNPSRSGA